MFIEFTEEEKIKCDRTDLFDYLKYRNEKIEFDGNIHFWVNNRGIKVNLSNNCHEFYDTIKKSGGHSIQFVKQYFNMNYPNARCRREKLPQSAINEAISLLQRKRL